IGPAEPLESILERRNPDLQFGISLRTGDQETDPPRSIRLLRSGGARPSCAAETTSDEIAPSHVLSPRIAPYHIFVGMLRCASQQNWPASDAVGHSRHSRHPGVSGSPQEPTFGRCPLL